MREPRTSNHRVLSFLCVLYLHVYVLYIYIYIYVCMYIHTYIYIYIYVIIYIYTHTFTYSYMYIVYYGMSNLISIVHFLCECAHIFVNDTCSYTNGPQ